MAKCHPPPSAPLWQPCGVLGAASLLSSLHRAVLNGTCGRDLAETRRPSSSFPTIVQATARAGAHQPQIFALLYSHAPFFFFLHPSFPPPTNPLQERQEPELRSGSAEAAACSYVTLFHLRGSSPFPFSFSSSQTVFLPIFLMLPLSFLDAPSLLSCSALQFSSPFSTVPSTSPARVPSQLCLPPARGQHPNFGTACEQPGPDVLLGKNCSFQQKNPKKGTVVRRAGKGWSDCTAAAPSRPRWSCRCHCF